MSLSSKVDIPWNEEGPRVRGDGEETEVQVRSWHASIVGGALCLAAYGWKIKKDGTPGAYNTHVPVRAEDMPSLVLADLLAGLAVAERAQRAELDACAAVLAQVMGGASC